MDMIFKMSQLREALADFDENDIVVVEVHDTQLNEDLYTFYIDVIEGIETNDGIVREVRICPVEHSKLHQYQT